MTPVDERAWLSVAAKAEELAERAIAYHCTGTPAESREAHAQLMIAVHDYARAAKALRASVEAAIAKETRP